MCSSSVFSIIFFSGISSFTFKTVLAYNYIFIHFIIHDFINFSRKLHFHKFHHIRFKHFQPTITFSSISLYTFYPFSADNHIFINFIKYVLSIFSRQLHFHKFHQIRFIHFQPTITFSYISSYTILSFSADNYIFINFIIYDFNIFSRRLHFHTFHHIRFYHF